jgi:hypothetical protein
MSDYKSSPNRFSDIKKLKYFALILGFPYLIMVILFFYYVLTGEFNETIGDFYSIFKE